MLALLLLALLEAGCRPQNEVASAPPPAPLHVAIDLWAGYYPLVIAAERGFLHDEHVQVDIQVPGDTHRMIADFAALKYDIIGVSLADVILTTRVNPDIRLMLGSDESSGADVLFGREPLKDAAQVRGKRIGTTLGGFGELFVREFLERQGLRPDEVTIVNVDAANVPDLMRRGEIDIGHTWEPYADEARAAGFQEWFSSAQTPGLILDGLVVQHALIRERPAELRGLVRAWFRGVDWWKAHPGEGNALVEHRLRLKPGSVSWKGIRLLNQADNRRAFAGDPTPGALRAASARYVEFFIAAGTLSQRLTADDLLESSFVRE